MRNTSTTIRRTLSIAVGAAIALLLAGAASPARLAPLRILVLGNDSPAWSPDGKEIAFTSYRHGKGDIYLMHPDGTHVRRLTTSKSQDTLAAWSPDGTKIAFASDRVDTWLKIFVMNADGSGQRPLTSDNGSDFAPTWSPDGTKIAFRSDRDGQAEIYTMNADGSDQTRLTFSPGSDHSPSWGPDGRIVFVSDRGTGAKTSLWVMNADGSDQHRLTPKSFFWNELRPVWSPDGKKIVFQSDRDFPVGNTELYSINADGTGLQRLTTYPGRDDSATWSPDGTRIAFARGPTPFRNEIYTMNPDGTHIHEITQPKLTGISFGTSPDRPQAGGTLRAMYDVLELSGADLGSPSVSCAALVGSTMLKAHGRSIDLRTGRATCIWRVPLTARGLVLRGSVYVHSPTGTISQRFALRVG